MDDRLYIISRDTVLKRRETMTTCCICDELKRVFLRDINICAKCVGTVPAHIPDEQILRYLKLTNPEVFRY